MKMLFLSFNPTQVPSCFRRRPLPSRTPRRKPPATLWTSPSLWALFPARAPSTQLRYRGTQPLPHPCVHPGLGDALFSLERRASPADIVRTFNYLYFFALRSTTGAASICLGSSFTYITLPPTARTTATLSLIRVTVPAGGGIHLLRLAVRSVPLLAGNKNGFMIRRGFLL